MTIWFASRFAPTYQGGLAAYERSVIHEFQQRTRTPLQVIYATAKMDSLPSAHDDGSELPTVALEASWFGRLSKPLWPRLAGKSPLHGILDSMLGQAWQRPQLAKPTVIHYVGTGWDFFGFAMASLAREYRARFVITPAMHPGAWGNDRIDSRLYRQADGLVCFTHQEGRLLQQMGVANEKVFVCPLPPTCRADGDGLRFRKEQRLDSQPCVLFVGRRDEGKGYPALLQAWLLVLRAVPEAVLVLAGPTAGQYEELLSKIPASNLRDLGVPDELGKADAIAGCEIFCLPSAHESFGIVFVDAWSYGKPVVCGTAPACREFITDGESGLWASQNPEELAGKLVVLLQNPDLRAALGKEGNLQQMQKFNPDIFFKIHFEALKGNRLEAT
jgi:glycosyltransferase involved in cell wall biosynthesis